MSEVVFPYKNHRGETSWRLVKDAILVFDRYPGNGYQPGWFIDAYDPDKKARRRFALVSIQIDESWPGDPDAVDTTKVARLGPLNPERMT